MTITTQKASVRFACDGASTDFVFPFEIAASSDLEVHLLSPLGSESLAVRGSDYKILDAGNPDGGTVRFFSPPVSGSTLLVLRRVPVNQPADYDKDTEFPSERIEESLDRVAMQLADLHERVDRSVRARVLDGVGTMPDMVLPSDRARAGRVLGFDAQGQPTVSATLTLDQLDGLLIDGTGGLENPSTAQILAAGTTTLRSLAERFSNVLHVKDFGAVGDGITDDSQAIQAAIDKACQRASAADPGAGVEAAGAVDFTGGIYRVQGVDIPAPCRLFSEDHAVLLPAAPDEGFSEPPIAYDTYGDIDGDAPSDQPYYMFRSVSDRVIFERLRFIGTQAVDANTRAFPKHMVLIDEKTEMVEIEEGVFDAQKFPARHCAVMDCFFEKGRHQVRGIRCEDLYIVGNKCTGTTAIAPNIEPSWPIAITGGMRNYLLNNTCWNNDGDGLKIGTDEGSVTDTLIVANNICYNNARDGCDINMAAGKRILVQSNQFYSNYASQLEIKKGRESVLDDEAARVRYVLVDGNNFVTDYAAEFTADGATGTFDTPFPFYFGRKTYTSGEDDVGENVIAYGYEVPSGDVLLVREKVDGSWVTLAYGDDYTVNIGNQTITLDGGRTVSTDGQFRIKWGGHPDITVTIDGEEKLYGADQDYIVEGAEPWGVITRQPFKVIFNDGHVPLDGETIRVSRKINTVNLQNNSEVQAWEEAVISNNLIAYDGVTVDGGGGHGIDLTDRTSRLTIAGNRFVNVPDGIKFDLPIEEVAIFSNSFEGYACFQMFSTSAIGYVSIENNRFVYSNRAIQVSEFDGGGELFIRNNVFVESGTLPDTSNCILLGYKDGATGTFSAVNNLVIADNNFTLSNGFAIRIPAGNIDQLTVSSNRFNIPASGRPAIFIDHMTTSPDVEAVTGLCFHDNVLDIDDNDPSIDFENPEGANEVAAAQDFVAYNNVRGAGTAVPTLTAFRGDQVINSDMGPGKPDYWIYNGSNWVARGETPVRSAQISAADLHVAGGISVAHGEAARPAVFGAHLVCTDAGGDGDFAQYDALTASSVGELGGSYEPIVVQADAGTLTAYGYIGGATGTLDPVAGEQTLDLSKWAVEFWWLP